MGQPLKLRTQLSQRRESPFTRAEHGSRSFAPREPEKQAYEDEKREAGRHRHPDRIRKEPNRTGNVVDWCWSRLGCRRHHAAVNLRSRRSKKLRSATR